MHSAILDHLSLFLQQLVNGITLGSIYALIAVGYTMIYGVVRLIDFAHAAVFMLGAFLSLSLGNGFFGLNLPFPLAAVCAITGCALVGVLLDVIAFRPLRQHPFPASLVTSVALLIILRNLALLVWGGESGSCSPAPVTMSIAGPMFQFGGVTVGWLQLLIPLSVAVLVISLRLLLFHTRFGRAGRALAQDRTAAALMGVDVDRVISCTFALASALGGAAGVMAGLYFNTVDLSLACLAGIKAFAAAALGGLGSIAGAVAGGGILGLAETLGAGYLSSPYGDGIACAVVLLVLFIRPRGLFGRGHPGGRDDAS